MQNDLIKIGFTPKNISNKSSKLAFDLEDSEDNLSDYIDAKPHEDNYEYKVKYREYYIQLLDFMSSKGIKYTKDTLVSRTFLEWLRSDLENYSDIYSNFRYDCCGSGQVNSCGSEECIDYGRAWDACDYFIALIDRALKQ